ncbi:unnamed protein product [Gadus morhua 'NCC']
MSYRERARDPENYRERARERERERARLTLGSHVAREGGEGVRYVATARLNGDKSVQWEVGIRVGWGGGGASVYCDDEYVGDYEGRSIISIMYFFRAAVPTIH